MGKEEIARNEQFLLFLQCFLLQSDYCTQFVHIFDIIFLFAAELEEPNIGIWGKGVKSKLTFYIMVKSRKDINNVSCHYDKTEMMLKVAKMKVYRLQNNESNNMMKNIKGKGEEEC